MMISLIQYFEARFLREDNLKIMKSEIILKTKQRQTMGSALNNRSKTT